MTLLLAAVARTLQEAKASGGDAVRVAGLEVGRVDVARDVRHPPGPRPRRRHEGPLHEAPLRGRRPLRRLPRQPHRRWRRSSSRTIQVAGLLHDVGKIGIPDEILRKPGKLTDAEFAIVKQHVALGDAIVRDLPDIDLVRAGIRHHHERWDGDGYLDRLAGEDIPLIARILAIGDAFSAMTTTRPYRKALDIREALHRLEDAAGSQLDETLVDVVRRGHRDGRRRPASGRADDPVPALWTPRVA